MKIWKRKGKSFTAYGIAPFFGIVFNKAGIYVAIKWRMETTSLLKRG